MSSPDTDTNSAQIKTKNISDSNPKRFLEPKGLFQTEILKACTISIFLFCLLGGTLHLWHPSGILITSNLIAILLLPLVSFYIIKSKPYDKNFVLLFIPLLIAIFFSDWFYRSHGFFPSTLVRGEITLLFLFSLLLWPYRSLLILPINLALILLLPYLLISSSNGRQIFGDDHPTFLYRLTLLKENFPFIPFFNPLWNAGIDARDFFATGALNIFLILSPIIYFIEDIASSYNMLICLVLFILTPITSAVAARLIGFSYTTASISAILAVTSSLTWYRWSLQFGTLGFITSTALLPLVIVLGSKFISDKEVSNLHIIATIVATSLTLFWTPAGLVLIPLGIVGLVYFKKLFSNKRFLVTFFSICIINLPWISLFWSVSEVGGFLKVHRASYIEEYSTIETKEHKQAKRFKDTRKELSIKNILNNIREAVHNTNPVIWIFLVPGTLLLPTIFRIIFASTFVWLLCLGAIGPLIKPQLELDRMFVILAVIAAVPAAKAISSIIEDNKILKFKLGGALAIAFVYVSTMSCGAIILNRTTVPITFASDQVKEIIQTIKDKKDNGRVLFSGFMLHEFSGGHLAPLALWSNTPIIASSPVHSLWQYQQVFPEEFLIGDKDEKLQNIKKYLDLMNVSMVFAHEPNWRNYFRKYKNEFEEIQQIGSFSVFKYKNFINSYSFDNSVNVLRQNANSVKFTMSQPQAVLKYNWFPFLEIQGCKIEPYNISKSITFISLKECEKRPYYLLKSVNPLRRWQLDYFR